MSDLTDSWSTRLKSKGMSSRCQFNVIRPLFVRPYARYPYGKVLIWTDQLVISRRMWTPFYRPTPMRPTKTWIVLLNFCNPPVRSLGQFVEAAFQEDLSGLKWNVFLLVVCILFIFFFCPIPSQHLIPNGKIADEKLPVFGREALEMKRKEEEKKENNKIM